MNAERIKEKLNRIGIDLTIEQVERIIKQYNKLKITLIGEKDNKIEVK